MNRLPKLALLVIAILALNPQRANASWVSHWLGLDHHTSAPVPTPTPIVQTVYAPPTTITIIQPYSPPLTVSSSPVASSGMPQASTYLPSATTLPVTGPKFNIALLLALATMSFLATNYVVAYNRFRKSVRSIDIL